jgi:protein-S-isoprenylcysteine O-methyltransferase Ste14
MEAFYAGGFKYLGVNLNRRGVRGVPFQDTVLLITLLLQITITMVAAYSDAANFWKMPNWDFIRTFGLTLFAISGLLIIFSALSLKQYFSKSVTVQQDHRLITRGMYRFIRHPWYLGMMLWGLGVSFVFLSLIGFALSLVLIAVYFWRISEEEKFMAQEFGGDWAIYKNKTRKLVPFLY